MSKAKDFNTVIVGGGPAGVACGITLRKRGYNCCIIDKHEFPREKLCGGIVTEKTWMILNMLGDVNKINEAVKGVFNDFNVYYGDRVVPIHTNIAMRCVDRTILDNVMMERYKELGGVLIEGEEVLSVEEGENLVVKGKKYTYNAQHIVAADGATSKVADSKGYKFKRKGFCIEIEIDKEDLDIDMNKIHIYFDVVDTGYAWVFPCGDKIKIGYGNVYDADFPYVKTFTEWCAKLGVRNMDKYDIKGAFIPWGEVLNMRDTLIMFVGDAGGFVDSLTGEGMYMAYWTGHDAALAIQDAEDSMLPATIFYQSAIQSYIDDINFGRFVVNFFLGRPWMLKRFVKVIDKRRELFAYILDMQISRHILNYRHSGAIFRMFRQYKKQKKLEMVIKDKKYGGWA